MKELKQGLFDETLKVSGKPVQCFKMFIQERLNFSLKKQHHSVEIKSISTTQQMQRAGLPLNTFKFEIIDVYSINFENS